MHALPAQLRNIRLACLVGACLTSAGGCSSVIGSAYLRDAWLDAVEHAAETAAAGKKEAAARGPGGAARTAPDDDLAADLSEAESAATFEAPSRRYATVDEAVADADRLLERTGGLTGAARDTLSTMLQSMPSQDWPVVVDEFTASLTAATPRPVTVPVREPEPPAEPPLPPAPPVPSVDESAVVEPVAAVAGGSSPAPEPPASEPVSEHLAVQNACFATRVRAWGAVDRFETSRFVPGQEVIVYFELDHLATRESTDGHTTRVDTSLRLVGEDGRRIHEWTFEPLEETCRSRRRDYFARYVLTLPGAAPAGPCRLEINVTDAVAGMTARATLPLEMQGR